MTAPGPRLARAVIGVARRHSPGRCSTLSHGHEPLRLGNNSNSSGSGSNSGIVEHCRKLMGRTPEIGATFCIKRVFLVKSPVFSVT